MQHQLGGKDMTMLVVDALGQPLHVRGDAALAGRTAELTNTLGAALIVQHPVYLPASCAGSCAPIVDGQGQLCGALAILGDCASDQPAMLALARMSANMIERQLFLASAPQGLTLHFHGRGAGLGTLQDGLASCSADGRAVMVNDAGLTQLGLPRAALASHTFPSLFGATLAELAERCRAAAPGLVSLRLRDGGTVHCRVQFWDSCDTMDRRDTASATATATVADGAHPGRRVRAGLGRLADLPSPLAATALGQLDMGDTRMAQVIAKLRKVAGTDIAVLITGETGSGKEWLAQAIHRDSPRARQPFVAINCASIPESLIESELFGYEDGAFTGARRKGSPGKIVAANGGTLFLDEIGDMPLPLQARLLRVLQERQVTPLGSARSIPVDIALVCATHRNLREQIEAHTFREDLYYRLNGLVVKLPALRERSDLPALLARVLAEDGAGCTLAPAVAGLLERHRWPGNLRQLRNVLRTAAVMAGPGEQIRPEHLADDFMDDLTPVIAGTEAASNDNAPALMLDQMELQLIQRTLAAHGGNTSAAARALGVSRNTIYRKLGMDRLAVA
ncbi:sigma-54-dependent Fis family transcriptional regulator [Rugamonas apoptosis]|uniref:Sigma 54-interacting transcriptional regulator n=1 Tax=Rugamonas apoptosis TaxID=2758570 RepID=A0A7W2FA24_9BURK|nr:sigma 54-interacting transcriptional regulator [Rugamonas apoptosis]MBA5687928.1 sigma 54-interacting transcriptional regulator [Rugamonas apoptosis]